MSESSDYAAPWWAWLVATGFGSGRLKPASGTWGSLAGWIAWLGLAFLLYPLPSLIFEIALGLSSLLLIFISVIASGLVVRQTNLKDPGFIVIDEWAGMFLALWPVRRHTVEAINGGPWGYALAIMFGAFLLFRLFDIWKPWPARRLESLPGGWGATMDDVMAGVMAGLMILFLNHITH